ncbi:MAG: AraC family transcriptional regulator, partial [Gammaproteobacteria bacterium]|nr:AraC family transcriptional regulator [Gammaproteobacteria bacterium]
MPQDNEVLLHQAQISTNYVRILLAKLSQKNSVDIDSFLAGRNLDKALLVRQDGMLPMSTFLLLMEEAAATTHDPCLGLHYYEDIDFKDLGIFGYALLNSESLGDALALSCRYYCLFQSDMKITLSTSGDRAQVAYQITARNLPYSRQDSEMTIMAIAMVVRRLIDDNWRPEAVYFQHPAPADTSEHKRLLCSNLHFDHPVNKIVFDKALLQAPVSNADTKLSQSLEATLEQLLTLRQLPSE